MNEVKMFILNNQIDIMLISEPYKKALLQNTILLNIPYNTSRCTAHGGTAIIIKNNIWHHELDNLKSDFLQAITVEVED